MPNYMTRKQYDKHVALVREVEAKRDLARKKVGEAASHGDLSENAEYEAAIEESGFLDGRLQELKSFLVGCEIVDPQRTAPGMVTIGKTIRVKDHDEGAEHTYHIVGNGTTDPDNGEVSFMAPLASQLLGKGVGDKVKVKLPGGDRTFEILAIDISE